MDQTGHDEKLEQQFIKLVHESWERYDKIEKATWLDDVFVGGVIVAHLDRGLFLLDVTSDGQSHYLLFSNAEKDRFVVRLDHSRAEDYVFAKVIGHLTSVELGFSRAFPDLSKIWAATKSEVKGSLAGEGRVQGYPDPGVMKIDATGTFATAQTAILVDLKEYVDERTLTCDHQKISDHFSAVYQSLEKYLTGIMA